MRNNEEFLIYCGMAIAIIKALPRYVGLYKREVLNLHSSGIDFIPFYMHTADSLTGELICQLAQQDDLIKIHKHIVYSGYSTTFLLDPSCCPI